MAPGAIIFLRLDKGIAVGKKMKFRVWTLEIGVQVLLSAHSQETLGISNVSGISSFSSTQP